MNRRRFLQFLTSFVLPAISSAETIRPEAPGICLQGGESHSPKATPNLIVIVLDELGYYELSCMGHDRLNTPHIDRMAAEGIRFTQALAGGPVCAPTRSVLMTGLHAGHTTVRANSGELALRDEDITVAEVLKKAGYITGGFGKWGLGDRGTTGVPERQGFDEFFGYYHQVHAHCYFPNYLVRNGEKVLLEGNSGDFYQGKQYAHHLIVDAAKAFIRSHKDRPFFCYCPWTPPHGLWGIPEDEPAWQAFKDRAWSAGQRTPRDARVYAAMVSMIDRQIGEIFQLLKDLEIDKRTFVMVCGDNGGQPYFLNGDPTRPKPASPEFPHGFFAPNRDPRTGKIFRGGKGSLYEGGLRIPMIMRWPGRIPAGRISGHLWYFPDILPTLAELAGAAPPKKCDGISLVPLLMGGGAAQDRQAEHAYLYWEYRDQVAVRIGNWKGIRSQAGRPWELYDLGLDVEEKNDIAARHPEILSRMQRLAEESHEENILGRWLDRSLGFKGHKFR